ncbi:MULTISPECIES: hypothetical protein [Prauserella]|uniref:Uncharacterized protein n=1 Tax=Prauserella endophytica TaxID=1592324 RepID=A0ABY2SBC2_9PSEU|nr:MULTISPECIES: hypothetical protein [Prauserella]TKG73189.1 hypothetical protein FCN18_00930 [Prauserella endophytica]
MLHIQDYEKIAALLADVTKADVWQIVHSYRAHRRRADGTTIEITIEVLRGEQRGLVVVARDENGRSATPGEPTWDLQAAIAATDWSALGV